MNSTAEGMAMKPKTSTKGSKAGSMGGGNPNVTVQATEGFKVEGKGDLKRPGGSYQSYFPQNPHSQVHHHMTSYPFCGGHYCAPHVPCVSNCNYQSVMDLGSTCGGPCNSWVYGVCNDNCCNGETFCGNPNVVICHCCRLVFATNEHNLIEEHLRSKMHKRNMLMHLLGDLQRTATEVQRLKMMLEQLQDGSDYAETSGYTAQSSGHGMSNWKYQSKKRFHSMGAPTKMSGSGSGGGATSDNESGPCDVSECEIVPTSNKLLQSAASLPGESGSKSFETTDLPGMDSTDYTSPYQSLSQTPQTPRQSGPNVNVAANSTELEKSTIVEKSTIETQTGTTVNISVDIPAKKVETETRKENEVIKKKAKTNRAAKKKPAKKEWVDILEKEKECCCCCCCRCGEVATSCVTSPCCRVDPCCGPSYAYSSIPPLSRIH